MRVFTLVFVILIALLQYPLWLGKGSWLRVWDLNRQIAKQTEENTTLKARNETLDAEVRDLKHGFTAIEERARSELGMVKKDEVFYQVLQSDIEQAKATPKPLPSLELSTEASSIPSPATQNHP
jgi:cell division protein FtsB